MPEETTVPEETSAEITGETTASETESEGEIGLMALNEEVTVLTNDTIKNYIEGEILILEGGEYRLDDNIDLSNVIWRFNKNTNITLDLNGHTFALKQILHNSKGSLNICGNGTLNVGLPGFIIQNSNVTLSGTVKVSVAATMSIMGGGTLTLQDNVQVECVGNVSLSSEGVLELSGAPKIQGKISILKLDGRSCGYILVNKGFIGSTSPYQIDIWIMGSGTVSGAIIKGNGAAEAYKNNMQILDRDGYGESYTAVINEETGEVELAEFHSHNDGTTFTPWVGTASLPTEKGDWYLTKDVTLNETWNVPAGEVNLCLNEKTVNVGSNAINVDSGAKLNIYDEEGDKGSITGSDNITGMININSGELTVNGGNIISENTAAIYSGSSGTTTINGGNVTSNGDSAIENYGKLEINGGTITSLDYYYVIESVWGSIIITGGNITGGKMAAVQVSLGTLEISGNAHIEAASAESNSVGVELSSDTPLKLSGIPTIFGANASIELSGSTKIEIDGELKNTAPYIIDMSNPGVFTTGTNAAEYANNFKPTKELEDKGYSVKVNADGDLELSAHEHEGVEDVFMPWTSDNSLPETSGNYYLTKDVKLSSKWSVPTGEVNLCLNGKSITNAEYVSQFIEIGADAKLNIYDEEENEGKIENSSYKGIVINSGELTVNGGTISGALYTIQIESGGNETVTINGGSIICEAGNAIYVNSEATVTINGGNIIGTRDTPIYNDYGNIKITGGTITSSSDSYYAVQSFDGSVEISGGNIKGGTEYAVYVSNGTLKISGNANIETTESNSVGVDFRGSAFKLSDSPTISGANAGIQLEYGCKIDIDGTLENQDPYIINMTRPGVFATGANAKNYAKNFEPSESLKEKGYSVTVNADGNLEMALHEHNGIKFMPWTSDNSLPDKAGNYYLTDNVTLSNDWNVPAGEVNLCLNGNNIECGSYQIWLTNSNAILSIYDCEETPGTITSSKEWGTIFINESSDSVSIYGGNIENTGEPGGASGGVAVFSQGTLNVCGGKIHGSNYAVYTPGAAVEVTVTGGTISGGECGIWFDGNTPFNLSGNPGISGTKAGIRLNGQINITDKLTGKYTIDMDTPGVFTSGAKGRATAENFDPSDELKAGGYVVAETEDGELVIAQKYTIEYRAGSDGTGEVGSTDKIDGVKTTLSEDKFTRPGYTQVGWTTKENGAIIDTTADGIFDKTDGQYALGDNFTENRDIILYPVWMKNKIVLDHDSATWDLISLYTDKNKVTIQPSTAESEITWDYDDEAGIIANIWKDGDSININVHRKAGTVKITFSADNGMTTAEFTVTVEKFNSDGTFRFDSEQTKEIGYGEDLELKVTTVSTSKKDPPPEKEEYSLSLMSVDLNTVEFYVNDKLVGTAEMYYGSSAALEVQVSHANGFISGSNTIKAVYGGDDSYNGSECTIEVTVTPKTITANIIGKKTKTYDGTTDVPESVTIELDGVLDGDDVKAAGKLMFESADAGSKKITAAGLTIEGDQKDCYALVSDVITDSGTITKKPLEIPAKEYDYDGKTSREITIDGVNGETVTAALTANSKNAGTYTYSNATGPGNYTVKFTVDEKLSNNYEVNNAGALTINKRTAEIKWSDNTSFIYDETAKTVTAEWKNKVNGDNAELILTDNVQTEVGDYTATAEIIGADSINYTLDGVETKQPWEITAAESGLTLSAKSETVTYGETVSLTATVKRAEISGIMLMSAAQNNVDFYIGKELIGTGIVTYADGSNGTAVVNVPATSAKYFKAGDNTVRAEYGGSHDLSGSSAEITIKVNKKTVTADIVGTKSKVYDGTNEITGLSLQLDGIVECDVEDVQATAESCTFNSADVKTAATITANGAKLSGEQAGNYTLTVNTIAGTITPAPIDVKAYSFTYDGDNVFEIQPSGIPGETLSATLTAASKNAGTYTYDAQENGYTIDLGNSNYAVNSAETLTINPLTAKLKWSETEFSYDGKVKEVTVTVTNAVDGDEFDISYEFCS